MNENTHAHDARHRIVEAAARVFAEAGYRGATTRRIAQAAGVNEVTLFRHFGSKDELIREALSHLGRGDDSPCLPRQPADPEAELTDFTRQQLQRLYAMRQLIRTCMGEGGERPEMLPCAVDRPRWAHTELRVYFRKLQQLGWADADADVDAAAAMLLGTLFSDAMGRDDMPDVFPHSIEEAPVHYVRLILGAVGVRPGRRVMEER
jgi:AcrR family transcriptional regulator